MFFLISPKHHSYLGIPSFLSITNVSIGSYYHTSADDWPWVQTAWFQNQIPLTSSVILGKQFFLSILSFLIDKHL